MKSTFVDRIHAEYRVGPGGIELRHIHITALEQVSRSSWQPCLAYRLEEAKAEVLHAADVYERIRATMDVEHCRVILQNI